MFYVLDGICSIKIENNQYNIQDGSILLIQSGTKYIFNICKPIKLIAINFDYTQKYNNISNFISPVKTESFNQDNILEKVQFTDAPMLNAPIIILNI